MKITSITRTVSGGNYDNISLSAEINEKEDPLACAIMLDKQANEMLNKIRVEAEIRHDRQEKNREATYRLEQILKHLRNGGDIEDVPF